MKTKIKKVIVAMSGGVDSSVAAKLLHNKDFKTIGVFLHFWRETPHYPPLKGGLEGVFENKCCSLEAFLDASRVCQRIGTPLYTMNFSKVFKKEIVDNFLSEYKAGKTPNPCVRCNKFVKLGLLIKRARELGLDYVASGHYVRLKREIPNSKFQIPKIKLYRARDKEKDQSYFLYNLTQEQLSRLIFPLGALKKEEVRKMARKFKLPVAAKKDSQEVCFISEKGHNEFLKRYIKMKPGPIKLLPESTCELSLRGARLGRRSNLSGRASRDCFASPACAAGFARNDNNGSTIGRHQGLPLYTIGQRRGLKIGGTGPYYAAKFDYKKNILYIVNDARHPALYRDSLIAHSVNWISGVEPKMPLKCEAVIRYRHKPAKCVIKTSPNPPLRKEWELTSPPAERRDGRGYNYLVQFSQPQRAVTPGQSVVFYKGEEVLGGGIIDKV